jgi:hypothetical protein
MTKEVVGRRGVVWQGWWEWLVGDLIRRWLLASALVGEGYRQYTVAL